MIQPVLQKSKENIYHNQTFSLHWKHWKYNQPLWLFEESENILWRQLPMYQMTSFLFYIQTVGSDCHMVYLSSIFKSVYYFWKQTLITWRLLCIIS